jgi:hypothetical protein
MSAVSCPNGHQSADQEWCDTCGAPISATPTNAAPAAPGAAVGAGSKAASATPAPGGGGTTPPPEACPHCSTLNPVSALFCESCGYDFTTGQAPEPMPTPEPVVEPTSAPAATGWLLVVEVDPEWFALKGELADQPCPPATTRTVPLVAHASLVGRSSQSKNVHPEIALDNDTGVSRRHAQFVTTADGAGLSVIDLSSTNGTYVVESGQSPSALTEPIVVGESVELRDGDRVYVGAWSRLTVRRST